MPFKLIQGGKNSFTQQQSLSPSAFLKAYPSKRGASCPLCSFWAVSWELQLSANFQYLGTVLLYSGTSYSHRSFRGPHAPLYFTIPCCQCKTVHVHYNGNKITSERRTHTLPTPPAPMLGTLSRTLCPDGQSVSCWVWLHVKFQGTQLPQRSDLIPQI